MSGINPQPHTRSRSPWLSSMAGRMAIAFCTLTMTVLLIFQLIEIYGFPFGLVEGDIKDITRSEYTLLSKIADSNKKLLTNWLEERREDVRSFAKSPYVADLMKVPANSGRPVQVTPVTAEWFETIRSAYRYDTVRLIDPATGSTIAGISNSSEAAPLPPAMLAEASRPGAEETIAFTVAAASRPARLHIIRQVGQEQTPDETPLLLVDFSVDLETILKPMLDQSVTGTLGRSGEVILVDGKKRFLTITRHPMADGSAVVPLVTINLGKPAQLAVEGGEGSISGDDYRRVRVLAAYRHIPLNPETSWGMEVKIDEAEALAPIRKQQFRALLFLLSSGIFTLACALIIARRLSKPLRSIAATANRIRGGDLDERVSLKGTTETIELGASFNAMVDRLKEAQEDLEQRVKERTGLFEVANIELKAQIEERKQAEAALYLSEKRFRDTLENVHLIAVTLDPKGTVTFCNEFLSQLTGWRKEEIIGANWFELFIASEFKDSVKGLFTKAISHGITAPRYETPIITRAGRLRAIVWDNTILLNPDNSIAGVASIGIDVTDHRHLEEQLRQSQKMEAIGQLAGGVAHDFNNILSVIMGYASLLEMGAPLDERQKEAAIQIINSSEKAAQLTRGLLAFSRKQVLTVRKENLNDIVHHIQKFLVRVIGEDVQLKMIANEMKLPVNVDSGQIEQVLMNLVTNARDAMQKGGTLTIETGLQEIEAAIENPAGQVAPGRYACIAVSDTGCGMDEETCSRIFEPFFTTKEVGKGTGLGMAIVFGIVQQHNGFINVYSEPGVGTTFRVHLPLVEGTQSDGVEKKELPAPQGGTETILLAEDEPDVRKLVTMVLTQFGYNVIQAEDGQDAVEKFAANSDRINLLLMDMIMPKKNGKEAYEDICRLKPGVKVLYSSGYTADFIQSRGVDEAGIELIMKPVQPMDLLRKVREMLDSK